MLRIRDKDRLFAEKLISVFDHCPAPCLFGEECGCEDCFFFNFSIDLELNYALFTTFHDLLNRWREHYDRKPSWTDLLKYLTYAILIIYSANGRKLPFLNQERANYIIARAQSNPVRFFNRAKRKLFKMNPLWLEEFFRICRKADIDGSFLNGIILVLVLLSKAKGWEEFSEKTKKQETPEKLWQDISKHLQKTRRV